MKIQRAEGLFFHLGPVFQILLVSILVCHDAASATSSTSSPPPTPSIWRLLVPSSPDGEGNTFNNDLMINPCNRSRYHITNSTHGVISEGPGNYTQDTTCEWLIEAPKGHWISLFLDEVETECSYDYLYIFDGNSYQKGQGRLLASFSGANPKLQVTLLAQSGYMLLLLFSDPNYTLEGFKAEYSISTCPLNCSGFGECVQIQNEHICKCYESRTGFACQDSVPIVPPVYTTAAVDNINATNSVIIDTATTIPTTSTTTTTTATPETEKEQAESDVRHLISANYKSPLARVGHSAVQLANILYIFGGYDLNDVLNDLWSVDLDANNTTEVKSAVGDLFWPAGRYGHASVASSDGIGFLVFGGSVAESGITDELLYFSLKTKEWTRLESNGRLPALAYHSMTKAGSYVYVYGGGTRWGGFSHSLYRFQENQPTDWELIISSCCGKSDDRALLGHSLTFWPSKNYLVLYGGVGAAEIGRFSKLSSTIYLYLIESNMWLKVDNRRNGGLPPFGLTPERAFHSAHIVGDYLSILGGYSHVHNRDETCYASVVLVYSLECHIFLPQKASMKLKEGIFAHQSVVWKDMFVLVGGYRGYLNQQLRKLPLPFRNKTTESCADYDKWQWQCASDPRCGWCPSSKRCFEKTSASNCTFNLHTLQCPGICSSLSSCMSCTLPGLAGACGYCEYLDRCYKKEEMKENCLPKPSANKSLKFQSDDCFKKSYRQGLTQIEYRFPIDFQNPDNVRITNTSILTLPRYYGVGSGSGLSNREVIAEMKGILDVTNYAGKNLEICTYMAEVNLSLSSREETYNNTFNWTDHHHCHNLTFKSGKPVLLLPDLPLQIFLSAKSFGPNVKQEKTGRVVIQQKFSGSSSLKSLKKENLRPFEIIEDCSSHETCLACMINALCSWETGTSKCINRTASVSSQDRDYPVILSPHDCPLCSDKRFCEECLRKSVGGVECEWDEMEATCNRKGRHENNTIKSVGECPLECHLRDNCSSCLVSPGCVWCDQQAECFIFSIYTSIYQFGKCYQWADKADQCNRCASQLKCEPCIEQMGCGWLYDDQGGLCTEGDFSGPYSLPPSLLTSKSDLQITDFDFSEDNQLQDVTSRSYTNRTWTYSACPDIDECVLNLHDCNNPSATCVNTPGSYKCICNRGYTGDGKSCEKTCIHPCQNGFCGPDYICECDIGWSGVDCSVDCLCNYHSYCENGSCDECIHHTTGKRCQDCMDTTYGNATLAPCTPCECNGHGDPSQGICDKGTGNCYCLDNTEGDHCEKCSAGYYGDPRNGQPCYKKCGGRVMLNGSEGYFGFLPEKFNVYSPKQSSRKFGLMEGEHMSKNVPVIKHCLWLIEASSPKEEEGNEVLDQDEGPNTRHEELIIEIGKEFNIPCSRNGLHVYRAWSGSRHHAPLVATVCSDEYDTPDVRRNVIVTIPGRSAAILFQFAQMGMVKLSFNASFRLVRKRTLDLYTHPVVTDSPIRISKLYDGRSVLSRFGHSLHLESKNMWIFGGYSFSHGPLNDIRHFDRERSFWEPVTITVVQSEEAVPTARYFHGATLLTPSSSILIHGGITSNLTFLSDTWKFDTRSFRWIKVCEGRDMMKLAGQTLTVKPERDHGYTVIMIGGFNSIEGFSDKVYLQSGNECFTVMETFGSNPIGIYGHSAVYHHQSDTVYVFGGMLYESHQVVTSSRLFSLHLPTKRWSILPPGEETFWPLPLIFPPRKLFHSAVSTDSYMLILGGSGNTRNVSMLAYVYACNSWQIIDQIDGQEELNRVAAGGAIYGHQVLSMGGLRKGSPTESIYQISLPEDILCSIHNSSDRCKVSKYCSMCSSNNNDQKEQCYKAELDMPTECSSGATNIIFWKGNTCSTLKFQEGKCERLRTCGECLAVWPSHSNSSQGCSWCTTNYGLGRCISANKTCEAENQKGQKLRTVTDSSYCSDCQSSNCQKCSASNCVWTRQIIRNAQRGIEVRMQPQYDWSCVPKFVVTSTSLSVQSSPPEPCSSPCSKHLTCQDCLKSAGSEGGYSSCRWSVFLSKCISPAHTPLVCFGGVCGAILQSDAAICPLDCGILRSCSACLQNPLCGWCSTEMKNGEGVCMSAEKVVGEAFSCGQGFNWSYQQCPKENECNNFHHDCDPVSEECIDLDHGYRCQCKDGYERTGDTGCVPVCSPACIHGKCVTPNKCECSFGYVGINCNLQCNCNSHSHCSEDDLNNCINCLNNTQGPNCAKCKAFFVGDPTNNGECISCFDYCKGHTSICLSQENYGRWCNSSTSSGQHDPEKLRDEILAGGVLSGPVSRAYCCGCSNNTAGDTCGGCLGGHFRGYNDLRQPCQKCECHGHSDTCHPETGLNCQCSNNTESENCSTNTNIQSNTHHQCWKMQCAKCKDHYLGTPIRGHQCYRQLNVDLESCFSPETKSCSLSPEPLLSGRTSFFAIQPKFMNVNIRIWLDVTIGAINVYLASKDDSFLVHYDNQSNLHKVEFDTKYGLAGIRNDMGGRANSQSTRNSQPVTTQEEAGVILGSEESSGLDMLSLENLTEFTGPTSQPLTTALPGMGYNLVQIEAAGFASYHTVIDSKAVLLVKNLRNRLVVTLPQGCHDLRLTRFYLILEGVGDKSYGSIFFRQDQQHIDLFVFFSVFFSSFFIFLSLCGILYKFKQTVDLRRARQRHVDELLSLAKRPFAATNLIIEPDPNSQLHEAYTTCRKVCRKGCICLRPIAVEYVTERGNSTNAAVCTMLVSVAGGAAAPVARLCLASVLVSLRPYPTHNIVRRRRIQTQ